MTLTIRIPNDMPPHEAWALLETAAVECHLTGEHLEVIVEPRDGFTLTDTMLACVGYARVEGGA